VPFSAYESLIKPLLFRLDPETAHNLTFRILGSGLPWLGATIDSAYAGPKAGLETHVFGLKFSNPLGLAAGLDKNARLISHWHHFGFGFVEVGTITPRPQAGNPRPRLFRLPDDHALINRMGFNNDGLEVIARRLEKRPAGLVIGANIGKNKDTPNEAAAADYLTCLRGLHGLVDYFTVNVSSPNTPGLRALQERDALHGLLSTLQDWNQGQAQPRPLLLKLAPDLTYAQLDDALAVAQSTHLAGLVATNTTIERPGHLRTPPAEVARIGAGGLSGEPLRERSTEVVRYLAGHGLPVIGVGGILNGAHAVEKIQAGASLVQVYTGFIYRGPSLATDIQGALCASGWIGVPEPSVVAAHAIGHSAHTRTHI
jgi:dihydroorotate dehydrogenase